MNGPRARRIPNHRTPSTPTSSNDNLDQLSKLFSSDEGCRLLSTVSGEEYKLLQDTKKILEERLNLDKRYAEDLQELTAKADRIAWPSETHSIASACRELLMQWSRKATAIDSNADQFRHLVIDNLIRNLLECKSDARKFLEDQKRQYEAEHRKAQIDVMEAEKRYLNEAKSFATRNSELTKATAEESILEKCITKLTSKFTGKDDDLRFSLAARIGDDNRLAEIKRSVIEKRENTYRAHNEYILTLREYNFVDEQCIRKVRNLLVYHETVQLILNRQWQSLLEAIAQYANSDLPNSYESLEQFCSIDPSHCYDEICKMHANIPLLTLKPIVFNELILQTSGLSNLRADRIIVDDTTVHDSIINVLRQKIRMITDNVDKNANELASILHLMDQIRDKETTYYGRKSFFEQEQQAENLRMRMAWEENLKNDLQEVFDDAGIVDDNSSCQEVPTALSDRLEDQSYFHGRMPRVQSACLLCERGDYLVRINDQGKTVLSILCTDPDDSNKLRDGHFYIYEKDNMYFFQANSIMKPTIPKLLTYYTRQKLELRDDGTRLIRPIEKPNYIINNDEIKLSERLGSGHFGEVTRGEYRNIPVAVKVLRSSTVALTSKDRDNFINEALLLKRYKHEQIVHFIGIAAYREPLMIVMELVEQGSLSNYVKQHELRVSQLTQMSYEIAKGMAYLERCNVVHRDLAARNCLVDKNGRIKVADFGLSRCLQDDAEYFTQVKEFPVRWWAVEVLSQGPYTIKSDVWSYGITVWEIFSKAVLPYTHIQHNYLVIEAVKRGERLNRPDKCPTNICNTMTSCWCEKPNDRPDFQNIVENLKRDKSILSKIPFFSSSK